MFKYSILTYSFNNYEILHEIENPLDDVEYVYVTDNPEITSKTWKIIVDEDLKDMAPMEACYSVRFNPWKYVSTEVCFRIDGSIKVVSSLDILYDAFEQGNYELGVILHPTRHNLIEEYKAWVNLRNYNDVQANKCIDIISHSGYDVINYKGMIEECFVIQRKTKKNMDIDRMTFAFLKYLDDPIERVDQIITSFVIQHYFKDMNLIYFAEQILFTPVLQWCNHGSDIPLGYNRNAVENEGIGYFYNTAHSLITIAFN